MPTLSGTPMAASTGESSRLPARHAEPFEPALISLLKLLQERYPPLPTGG